MNPADLAGLLPVRFDAVRAASERLAEPLSDEDCCAQSMPDASPVKWHLAHTTWFFETFVLEAFEPGFAPHDASFRMLFNSYYNGVGKRPPRPQRGLLTRPSMRQVRHYRAAVDARLRALLARGLPPEAAALVELGLQHEQQHQELVLTDVKHLLSTHPLSPPYRARPQGPARPPTSAGNTTAPGWVEFDAGIVSIGADGSEPFAFDNERPRHRQFVEPFALADRLATNAEFAAFVDAGGYRQPQWWLSEGWDFVQREALAMPAYWRALNDGARGEFTLAGLVPLDPHAPVSHLSYFEADAFARWAGARLPTEFEWEHAARALPVQGNFVESGRLHPQAATPKAVSGATAPGVGTTSAAAPAGASSGASAAGLADALGAAASASALGQMFGDLWEWTSSSYAPYPGFAAAPGAVGEYNGKFMVNQYVLRGGSCATPRSHVRASYRNFFPAYARWQFSGVRLARSL